MTLPRIFSILAAALLVCGAAFGDDAQEIGMGYPSDPPLDVVPFEIDGATSFCAFPI
ncbi:MAG: hypothetical protein HUK22_08475, partial [Thermoguttaceae bacterium]|nr:hypothetical protein [Thermoguttaceae bacterium]